MKINIPLLITIFVIVMLSSCKKSDLKSSVSLAKQANEATIERAKQAMLSRGEPVSIVMPLNEKAIDIYFSDVNNNRIDMTALKTSIINARVSVCDYQYDDNFDPIEDMFPSNFLLNSTGFIYDCGSGNDYRITFEWGLAVHHSIWAQKQLRPRRWYS